MAGAVNVNREVSELDVNMASDLPLRMTSTSLSAATEHQSGDRQIVIFLEHKTVK